MSRPSAVGRWTCTARRPAASSDAKSPSACASSSVPKVNGYPGIVEVCARRGRDQRRIRRCSGRLCAAALSSADIADRCRTSSRHACGRRTRCGTQARLVGQRALGSDSRRAARSNRPGCSSVKIASALHARGQPARALLGAVSVMPPSASGRRRARQCRLSTCTCPSSVAGRVLRLLDVGFVERVDLEQRARDRRRNLPAHELRAERGGLRPVDRRRRAAGRLELASSLAAPAPSQRVRRLRRTGDRRRSGPDHRAASPAIGTTPAPCFPVLSAISCSTHRPNGSSARRQTGQLVTAFARGGAEEQAERDRRVAVGPLRRRPTASRAPSRSAPRCPVP